MSKNRPDKWVVIKIDTPKDTIYKVYATWYGGYLDGDRWKMNSGITKIEEKEDYLIFHGDSGSIYECPKVEYGTSSWTGGILNGLIEDAHKVSAKLEVLPEDTDWLNLV